MPIKPEEIATLIELFEASQWDELHVEIDGLQLFLSTDPNARLTNGAAQPALPVSVAAATPVAAAPARVETTPAGDGAVPATWVAVTAPNLGTFYRAPKPGAAPLVELGQSVEAATEVCLLEVMKLFTAVSAGTRGVVRRICVNDADMVEYGQTLFYIEPA